jgi:hypothetical protein
MDLYFISQKILSLMLLTTLQSACAMNENLSRTNTPVEIKYNKILLKDEILSKKLIDIATTFFIQDKKTTVAKEFYILDVVFETNVDYSVTFSHKDHPKNVRGSVPTMRPYTVYIDKVTFKVLGTSLSR